MSADPVVLVVPVFRNAATLRTLRDRVDVALGAEPWVLRLVIDACPEGSGAVADALAAEDPRVRVTHQPVNLGQHAALATGLGVEPSGCAWVVLDADLQDPPEAVPSLLAELRSTAASGVFAGRRGDYESASRRLTGGLHRRVLHAVIGLPEDAGAFLAMDARLRSAVLDAMVAHRAPSIVAAAGVSGLRLVSLPVQRATRPVGTSAWSSRARVEQGLRTVSWALRHRGLALR